MTAGPAIRVEGLVKDYGNLRALHGIDLEVHRGEVFGFLGPNGAGKTTTIRCLLDLLRPTSGRVEILGHDPHTDGVTVRSRIAYVPGELRLPERMTAAQLVASIGRLRGGVDRNRRDELAERLALDLHRRVRDLSSGNRRKVVVLLAFLANAELLVLDEPTNGLDPLMQQEFVRLLGEVRASGATVFLSSHAMSEVQRTADRVAVLRAGEVVAVGAVEDLRRAAHQRVEIWFEGDPPQAQLMAVPGLKDVVIEGARVSAVLTGPVQPLLMVLSANSVTNLLVEERDLEETFLDLYGGTPGGPSD